MRLLICGSREWADPHPINAVLSGYQLAWPHPSELTLVNGLGRGADRIALDMAQARGIQVMPFPPDWDQYGKAAGPVRNQRMLELGAPDVVWAFRLPGESRGTDHMVSIARTAGVPTYVVGP